MMLTVAELTWPYCLRIFFLAFVGHELEHTAEVLDVDERPAVVVAVLEHQCQHALLGVVQFEDASQQHWAELAHRGAQAGTGFLAQGEQLHGHGCGFVGDVQLRMARRDLVIHHPGSR